jgi:hypothetical protein
MFARVLSCIIDSSSALDDLTAYVHDHTVIHWWLDYGPAIG